MAKISATELAALRADYDDIMGDTLYVGSESAASADWSSDPATGTWTYTGSAIACGVTLGMSKEILHNGQPTMTDGVIRIPIGTSVTGVQRVRVTKRHGETLSPAEDYAVIGSPRRGAVGLQLAVQRVVGNSSL